jgi:2-polyprenyl-3-methyl-5-hydroxy-6-metoxy-1,4-benzoquinol methylase
MIPDLDRRRPELDERMDDPACDPARLEATYRQFAPLNRWLARWPDLYRRYLRPLFAEAPLDDGGRRVLRVLDVGCGGGDVLRDLVRRGWKDGHRVAATGIDPDPRAVAWARARHAGESGRPGSPPAPTFLEATAAELAGQGDRFDVVVSNHVLHHLSPDEVRPFLEALEALALRRVLVSDIRRSRAGYGLFALVTWPLERTSFLRGDGLLSIRKSFTPGELEPHLPAGWRLERRPPFRLLALRDPERAGAAGAPAA